MQYHLKNVARFMLYEVLQFRRLHGLLLAFLMGLVALSLVGALAVPHWIHTPLLRAATHERTALFPWGPDLEWRWERLMEVAEGRRRFAAEDIETFRRQALPVASFCDWYSQDEFFRLPKRKRQGPLADPRRYVEDAAALTFYLDGLDAEHNPQHAQVFEAGLRHVEEIVQPFGDRKGGIVLAMLAEEYLLHQLLRHLHAHPEQAREAPRYVTRLEAHFRHTGDMATLPDDAGVRRNWPHFLYGAIPTANWPSQRDCWWPTLQWPHYSVTTRFPSERECFEKALALPVPQALSFLASQVALHSRVKLKAQSPLVALGRFLTCQADRVSRLGELEWALSLYQRHLVWNKLRRDTLSVLRLLSHEAARGVPIPGFRTATGFRVRGGARKAEVALSARTGARTVPPAAPFTDLFSVLRPLLARCEALQLEPNAISITRPAGGDLPRARVSVGFGPERFYRLAALLKGPELHALGGRGELSQINDLHRELVYDVPVAATGEHAPQNLLAPTLRSMATQLRSSNLRAGKFLVLARTGRTWELLAK